jgi:hypothetical protein
MANEAVQPENTISSMRDSGEFLDVDLRCKDGSFGIQKLVLIMHSEYYRRLFLKLDAIAGKTGKPNANACIILEDVEPLDIVNIITYLYEGKVNVMMSDIPGFIAIAKQLHIEDIQNTIPDVERIQKRIQFDESPQIDAKKETGPNLRQKRTLIDSLHLMKGKGGKRPKVQKNKDGPGSSVSERTRGAVKAGSRKKRFPMASSSEPDSSTGPSDLEDSDSRDYSSVLDAQATRVYRPGSGTWVVKDNSSFLSMPGVA